MNDVESDLATRQQRLRWRCRRGMRELDAAMRSWLDQEYPRASDEERDSFEALLDKEDPELFALLLGRITEDRHAKLLSTIGKNLRARRQPRDA